MVHNKDAVRTHDSFYADEDRSQQPKEYFKWLMELTRQNYQGASPSVLDVGCASGDFLYYFGQNYPQAKLAGVDVMQSLLDAAAKKLPSAELSLGNINSPEFKAAGKYDLLYLLGVHSIFDEPEVWLKNFTDMLKDQNSVAFIFGLFNPFPYDVLMRVRKSGETGEFEPGWNSISRQTVTAELAKNGCKVEFLDWSVPIDIEQNPSDGLRSWTTKMHNGKNLTTNATRMIHDFCCAVIRKN